MNILKLSFRSLMITIIAFGFTACMSLGQLSYKQAKLLKKEGFSLTDEGWTLNFPENLVFEFNQPHVQESQKAALIKLSKQLKDYNLITVRMVGHTDSVGHETYNQKLSIERAKNVAQIFKDSGFKSENITVIGRGDTQPIANNNTAENRAANRRVTLVIVP